MLSLQGLTLISRLAAGTELPVARRLAYLEAAASMQLSYGVMRDESDGLYAHSWNAADRTPSCCKWGRANGWGMLSHLEVLGAIDGWPVQAGGKIDFDRSNLHVEFVQRVAALVPFQDNSTGLWHQVLK